jgi:hypothetical protein
MGTSLSGLTPATTFDGLLKVGDNDPLTADLKAISTGDGTDTILQLSNSALSIGGTLDLNFDGQTNVPMQFYGAGAQVHYISGGNNLDIDYVTTGITENVRLAYNVANRDVSIGQSSSMGAKLGIKGSGASSGTTSLLVQNSDGDELFKLTDDGNINLGEGGATPIIQAQNNSGRSLKLGSSAHLSSFFRIDFKTFDGVGYSEAMRITGDGEQRVGIGESTPTARLQVKGSGNDATTTALLVQNSDGVDMFRVKDSGYVDINPTNSSGGSLQVRGDGTDHLIFANANDNYVGIGGTQGSSAVRAYIKGKGTTSATTALLVQNSAGTELMKVTDGGLTYIKSAVFTTSAQFRGFVDANNNSNLNFIVPSSGNSFVISKSYNPSNDASALLDVQSTTQGFLPPRMTDAEKNAIATPAAGLMIYNTDANQMSYYNGTSWVNF